MKRLFPVIALTLTACSSAPVKTETPAPPPHPHVYGTFEVRQETTIKKARNEKACKRNEGVWFGTKCVVQTTNQVSVTREGDATQAEVSFAAYDVGTCSFKGPALVVDEKTVSLMIDNPRSSGQKCHFILNYNGPDEVSVAADSPCGCDKGVKLQTVAAKRVTAAP